MTVRLRLQRHGAKKRPFYRVVAADQRAPRDGRYIELLGTYDPMVEPPAIRLNSTRIEYWMGVGAQPSETVHSLIKRIGQPGVVDTSQVGAEEQLRQQLREAKKKELEARRAQAAEAAKAADEARAAEEAAKKAAEEAEKKAAEEAAAAGEEAGGEAAGGEGEAAGEEPGAEGGEEA